MRKYLIIAVIGIICTITVLALWLTNPVCHFKREANRIAGSKMIDSYGINTFANNVSSQDIVDLVYWCNNNLTNTSPIIYSWEDRMGYPGLSLIWQGQDRFLEVYAFCGNDAVTIKIRRQSGRYDSDDRRKKLLRVDIEEINNIIDTTRMP